MSFIQDFIWSLGLTAQGLVTVAILTAAATVFVFTQVNTYRRAKATK